MDLKRYLFAKRQSKKAKKLKKGEEKEKQQKDCQTWCCLVRESAGALPRTPPGEIPRTPRNSTGGCLKHKANEN